MRLIDADALISFMKKGWRLFPSSELRHTCDITDIESAPTIDAELVKHGYWIDVNGDGSLWRCSVCGETQCCDSNYCGECGAKMDMAVAYYADNKLVEKVVIDERKEDENL